MLLKINLNDIFNSDNYNLLRLIKIDLEENFIEYIHDYIDKLLKNYNNKIKFVMLYYNYYEVQYSKLPVLELGFDLAGIDQSNFEDKILLKNIVKNIYKTVKHYIRYISYLYNKITSINLGNYYFTRDIDIDYILFYESDKDFGTINNYNFTKKVFNLQNSKFRKLSRKKSNRIKIGFSLILDIYENDDLMPFISDDDLRYLLRENYKNADFNKLSHYAQSIIKDIITNELDNEDLIDLNNTNIKEYSIDFIVTKQNNDFSISYYIIIDLLYHGLFNPNYLQLDKIIKLFTKISKYVYLQPIVEHI